MASTVKTQRMVDASGYSILLSKYAVQGPIKKMVPLTVNRLCLNVIEVLPHKPAQGPDSETILDSVKLTNNTDHSSQHFYVSMDTSSCVSDEAGRVSRKDHIPLPPIP